MKTQEPIRDATSYGVPITSSICPRPLRETVHQSTAMRASWMDRFGSNTIKYIVIFCLKCGTDPRRDPPPLAQRERIAISGRNQRNLRNNFAKSNFYSALINVLVCELSRYTRPRYTGTRLYFLN